MDAKTNLTVPPEIFNRMIEELYDFMRAYARTLTKREDTAQDLVHDTIALLLRFRERFQADTNFKAWTFRIMKNKHFSGYRRAWRQELPGDDFFMFAESPDNAAARRELVECFEAMDTVLDPFQRRALILIAIGNSYEEVAEEMMCPVGTIKSMVGRGRSKLALAYGMDAAIVE